MIQPSLGEPTEIIYQTFTDTDGRVPEMEFQGMKDRVEFDGYLIQVESILPFPQRFEDEIKAGDYQIGLIVTRGED